MGLFLIWNRRLRCGVGGKLLWSVATLAVFCGLILALLTVPTGNAEFQRFQDDANDFLETAGADLSIAWETFSERAGDAFGNMRSVACSIGNYALNKALRAASNFAGMCAACSTASCPQTTRKRPARVLRLPLRRNP